MTNEPTCDYCSAVAEYRIKDVIADTGEQNEGEESFRFAVRTCEAHYNFAQADALSRTFQGVPQVDTLGLKLDSIDLEKTRGLVTLVTQHPQ
jgi:hypothetical protein